MRDTHTHRERDRERERTHLTTCAWAIRIDTYVHAHKHNIYTYLLCILCTTPLVLLLLIMYPCSCIHVLHTHMCVCVCVCVSMLYANANWCAMRWQESFAVIRHPYKRAVSEFCYRLSIKDQNPSSGFAKAMRESYKRVYGAQKKDGDEEENALSSEDAQQKHCELFNDWMLPILKKGIETVARGKLYDAKDCHFLSQWEYMKYAEWVLEAETMSETIRDLMALYGYDDFDLSRTSIKTTFKGTTSNSENSSPPECAPMTFMCFNDAIAEYLQAMDSAVFDIFEYERDWRRVMEEYAA